MITIAVEQHPLLELGAFLVELEDTLENVSVPDWLAALLFDDVPAPLVRSEEIRLAARDLLRFGGYKPTGRGKPASEYLVRTAGGDGIRSINLIVDACNVVSLHSGLPISVVDADLVVPPLRVGLAPKGVRYVFNPSGQEIDVGGLLCLHDARGPCANAVKDAQRTKTNPATRRALALVWGHRDFREHTEQATAWYRQLLREAGASSADVEVVRASTP